MFTAKDPKVEQRLKNLEAHLAKENPVLLDVVKTFRQLDRVARRIGFFDREESYALRVPWWPLVSVLGTFSSGKSTFINHYLGYKLQLTGNQAVDDKFTVISFSGDQQVRTLPGLALDADPRFPFFRISEEIEEVAAGEGRRIDAYMQLKTCPSDQLRGKILIDSPGFDADAQRTSTLRITKYIVDLSDLVLVLFDARHPEPGAMQDTLNHLVGETIHRPDSNKFLYVLNQIDTTAREDNPEEVVGAWQRALAQQGLTAGRFYRIYDPEAAIPIGDPQLRVRFETKRDQDMSDIYERMREVEVERAYRIIGVLEKTAHDISGRIVPYLRTLLQRWRRRVLWAEGALAGALVLALGLWVLAGSGRSALGTLWQHFIGAGLIWQIVGLLVLAGAVGYLHYTIRRIAARGVAKRLHAEMAHSEFLENYLKAFQKNTGYWRSVFLARPAGWGGGAKRRLQRVLGDANLFVQRLNDTFTNPSGDATSRPPAMDPAGLAPAPAEPAESAS